MHFAAAITLFYPPDGCKISQIFFIHNMYRLKQQSWAIILESIVRPIPQDGRDKRDIRDKIPNPKMWLGVYRDAGGGGRANVFELRHKYGDNIRPIPL